VFLFAASITGICLAQNASSGPSMTRHSSSGNEAVDNNEMNNEMNSQMNRENNNETGAVMNRDSRS
jgi:hypothetical protein